MSLHDDIHFVQDGNMAIRLILRRRYHYSKRVNYIHFRFYFDHEKRPH